MKGYIDELRESVGTRPLIVCGANVIIMDDNHRILMHHRRDNDRWGLPGGMMELKESLEENAVREVFEETGITCLELKLFNIYSGEGLYYKYPDGNEVYYVTTTFVCKKFIGEVVLDLDEGKAVKFFSVKDIPSRLSPPIAMIIEEFKNRYDELVAM